MGRASGTHLGEEKFISVKVKVTLELAKKAQTGE